MNDFLRKLKGWILLGMAIGALSVVVKRLVEISRPGPGEAKPASEIPVPPVAEPADPLAAVAQGLLAAGLVAPAEKGASPALAKATRSPRTRGAKTTAPADDLTKIWGIGPKIAGLLNQAGIVSYTQLAETDLERLQEILQGGSVRLAKPQSWPEQARLAAAGQWDELPALVQSIKSAA